MHKDLSSIPNIEGKILEEEKTKESCDYGSDMERHNVNRFKDG